MADIKHVPDRMIVGSHGQSVLEPGYTEIGGVRIYPDRMVVGSHGQPEIRRGGAVLHPEAPGAPRGGLARRPGWASFGR